VADPHLMDESDIVVIGAGIMGMGIAHGFVSSGYSTLLVDISPTALDKATASIANILETGVRLGKVTPDGKIHALTRLATANQLPIRLTASLLVETATEALPLKLELMRAADAALPAGATIATNTSALSVTEIASALTRPERLIGMHFFNPVHKMKLVEIVQGLMTSTETVEKARAYVDRMGKTAILVSDTPGLTTSRMSALLGNEAMTMLMEGVASAEDIDTALRLGFNHPMGPLELGDLTGWDTRLKVLEYLHQTLGEKYRPCPLIRKMVKAGRTGCKVGAGVYRYEDSKRVPNSAIKGGVL
jgi:3-hydroxybutyryl-CoA dehydrogenase